MRPLGPAVKGGIPGHHQRRRLAPPPGPALPPLHGRVGCRAVTIVPDTKDWTWVLERPCPECGLDTQGFSREAVAGMIRANAEAWQDVLAGSGPGHLRPPPSPLAPPALPYCSHVPDVHP